jgi:hypothetical protein
MRGGHLDAERTLEQRGEALERDASTVFRFDEARWIVEYRDVLQVIPDRAADDNGTFSTAASQRRQDVPSKSTSSVPTAPAVRPGAVW